MQPVAAVHGGVGFDVIEVFETMGYDAIVIMLKVQNMFEYRQAQ